MSNAQPIKLAIHGLEKYSKLYLYIQTNTGNEYLYQNQCLNQISLGSVGSEDFATLDTFVTVVINDTCSIRVNVKQRVLFHCVLQVVENHPNLEYIYKRPHVVGCLTVTLADLSNANKPLFFGLNSNYQYQIPYNNCKVYMTVLTPFGNVTLASLQFPLNPIHEFFKNPNNHVHGKIPIIPTWMIEGIDAKSWNKAIDFGVPIHYLYQFNPDVPFVSAKYLEKRYVELCTVFGIEIDKMRNYLALYPTHSNEIDNQFCEGFLVKMATTEVTTRPYMKDFQINKTTGDIIDTDYYMLFKYTIGDCAFDANIIYRIWMSILFCKYESSVYIDVLRSALCKIGVPIVIKGHAGLQKSATFGHMFAALIKPERFAKITNNPNFVSNWQHYFGISDVTSTRLEQMIIGEGTTPATAHYSSHRKSDPTIDITEEKLDVDAPWTHFTHPIHLDNTHRFHREVLEIFTWVLPLIEYDEHLPCKGTMWHFHNGKSCRDIQMEITNEQFKVTDLGRLISKDNHKIYSQIMREYYLPDYTLTESNKDLHVYLDENLFDRFSTVDLTNNESRKMEIRKFIYVYHLNQPNLMILKKETIDIPYSITKCGYCWVITLFKSS